MDDKTLDYASPLRGNDFEKNMALRRLKEQALADRGYCMLEEPEPTAFVGLAKIMTQKFPLDPIDFTRQTAATFGFPAPEPKGIDFNH